MQINLNPTSERGASRDAVNRPRETLGDSHLISIGPSLASGWYVTFFCCRGTRSRIPSLSSGIPGSEDHYPLITWFV